MYKPSQKELINVVVFYSIGHFFVEISRLPWLHLLNVEWFGTGSAELVPLEE